ncbi:Wd40 repeat protein [Globisporangium polare]
MSSQQNEFVELCALEGHRDRAWHVSWRFDGKLLASCSGDKTIRLWAPPKDASAKWECVAILEDAQGRTIRACEWSPDGRYIASVSFDATTVIWEKQGNSYEVVSSLEGHESEVKSVAWSPSGAYIATCSRDKSVWIWEADPDTDFECISVLHGHTQDVKFVKWHPTEDLLVSVSYDDTVRIWAENEDDWYCKETLNGHNSTVWGVATDPSGSRLASVSDDKSVIIWQRDVNSKDVGADGSPKEWKQAATLAGFHERTIFSVDWSAQGSFIVTGAADDAIRIFRESTNASTFELAFQQNAAHSSDINCVRWSPEVQQTADGRKSFLLASAADDALVRIWRFTPAQ